MARFDRIRRLLTPPPDDGGTVAATPPVPLRDIFRRFWPYARRYRRWLLLTLVLVALAPAIETASIWMFKLVVDEVLVPRDFGPFPLIALAYVGLTLLSGAVNFADDLLSTWIGERFLLGLRTEFFSHVQRLSLGFFDRRPLGDITSRITGDVAAIETLVLSGVADALSYVFTIVFFTAALFYIQWELALVSLVVAPLFFVTARRFSRLIKRASRENRRRSGSISAVAQESLSNAQLVQAYNREDAEDERFHRRNVARYEAQMTSARIKGLFTPVVDLLEVLAVIAVLAMGTWELSENRMTLGALLAFAAYLSQLYSPIRGLSRLSNTFFSASASAERIIEFLDEKPEVADRPDAKPLDHARGEVELRDVSFRYDGAEHDALSGVSLAAAPGETLALVGPSGAGKSTVAKLLLRFYDPESGAVTLDGTDLRQLRMHDVRENVAVLLQEALVFDGTVRENIAYGRTGATEGEIERAARAADAHEFILALPDGYETSIGQRGRLLSGGQRQRIAIARAMVRDAPVLILDEPTTGLDANSARRVLEPLRRLMDGRTTIVISHNLMTVRDATSIVVLEGGRVTERGTHDELMAAGRTYAGLYRVLQAERPEPALEA